MRLASTFAQSHSLLMPPQSLGWIEMRTTLSKLFYRYDVDLLDKGLGWWGLD